MKQYFNIKNDEGQVIGEVIFDENPIRETWLDLALTPIVEIDKDADPKATGFLISQRTTLDTRRREEDFPHRHLGTVLVHGNLPDHDETVELSKRGMLDD